MILKPKNSHAVPFGARTGRLKALSKQWRGGWQERVPPGTHMKRPAAKAFPTFSRCFRPKNSRARARLSAALRCDQLQRFVVVLPAVESLEQAFEHGARR